MFNINTFNLSYFKNLKFKAFVLFIFEETSYTLGPILKVGKDYGGLYFHHGLYDWVASSHIVNQKHELRSIVTVFVWITYSSKYKIKTLDLENYRVACAMTTGKARHPCSWFWRFKSRTFYCFSLISVYKNGLCLNTQP